MDYSPTQTGEFPNKASFSVLFESATRGASEYENITNYAINVMSAGRTAKSSHISIRIGIKTLSEES
jgi:hypothetical protein